MPSFETLGAKEAVRLLARGELTAQALVAACLQRIAAEEPQVQAWEWLEPEAAMEQARAADAHPRPPLYGLPVGIKDIIDTEDMPTACGSPVHRNRRPTTDAACVAALRAAGAVILGKTVTTEFAVYTPGRTRNPRRMTHTPGGSSSGSAAAVAAWMVPAALGTQTAGSVIRPASFCGVFGFKPTFGRLPMEGVHPLAPSLDTLGIFTRALEDLPLLLGALGVPIDEAQRAQPLRVGLWRTELWGLATAAAQRCVEGAARALASAGARVQDVELSVEGWSLAEAQATIMAVEAASSLAHLRASQPEALSARLRLLLDEGASTPPARYRAALAAAETGRRKAKEVFREVDVLLTPSAMGEAPEGLGATGDPAFNRIPTLLGLPCLNVPGAAGPEGLPIGLQLVGHDGGDSDLLNAAVWVSSHLGGQPAFATL
jgi:Asp-tRNA(Asn)/Glu-tRNA(Gln) amidotransferase A subunit family amidase